MPGKSRAIRIFRIKKRTGAKMCAVIVSWIFCWRRAGQLPSVASKRVHVRKKQVLIGRKHDMFCHQTFEVWSRRLLSTWFVFAQQNILCKNFWTLRILSGGKCAVSEREICLKVEKNEIWAESADQKHINNLPLARQFALTAVKIQMFGGKTRHVWHLFRTCFIVSCTRLDATNGIGRLLFVST